MGQRVRDNHTDACILVSRYRNVSCPFRISRPPRYLSFPINGWSGLLRGGREVREIVSSGDRASHALCLYIALYIDQYIVIHNVIYLAIHLSVDLVDCVDEQLWKCHTQEQCE